MNAEGRHARRPERDTFDRTGAFKGRATEEAVENERFLRPYAIDAGTAEPDIVPGRASGPVDLDLLSLVVAARTPGPAEWLRPEREAILAHALHARTVAEIAAEIRLPVGQVRGMVAAMIAEGALQRCGPSRPLERQDILHAVLVGLRSL
ncbi:DUF742 domain-containing protein [Nocardiopsis listeri]|uniref:DUF742 domain-containing protein n=1 Tax=Nocardiopsis listeri TaxID=53440 RepID=UPI0008365FD5|nr:DUF742 domain-containing protein [Nocardiopsis listeri]